MSELPWVPNLKGAKFASLEERYRAPLCAGAEAAGLRSFPCRSAALAFEFEACSCVSRFALRSLRRRGRQPE